MTSQPLVEAIALAKQGKKKEARLKFMEIIKDDPHEVMAYLWLVDLLENSEEKVTLLERCLMLNPESQMTRDALEVVLEQQIPELDDDYELPQASMAVYKEEHKPKKKKTFKKILKPALWVVGLSLLTILVLIGIRFLPDFLPSAEETTIVADSNVGAATWTPPATGTPTVTPTATPGLPVGFGTPVPPPVAMISAYDISQLEVFAQWGTGIPLTARWTENGDVIAVTSRSVDVIEAAKGKIISSFSTDLPIRVGDVCPAGEIAAIQTADGIMQWITLDGESAEVQPFAFETEYLTLTFSPDCALMAGVAANDSLVVWDVAKGDIALQPGNIYGGINVIMFSDDHSLLALGTDQSLTWIIDTKTGAELSRLAETTEGVNAVAFSGDGNKIAMASNADDYVSVWNLEENHRQRTIALNQTGVSSLAYGNNDALLAIGYDNGEIILRDEAEREIINRFSHYQSEILALKFDTESENLLSLGSNGSLLSWEINDQSGKTVFTPEMKGSVFTADISPNGQYLVLAGSDSQIHIFDVASQTKVASMRGHLGSVWYVDISADGNWLLSGGRDGTVRLWSLETFEQEALLGEHGGYVRGVAFSPDGKYGVSASSDEMVKVWDLVDHKEVHTLVGHIDEVQYAFFSDDGNQILSLGNDGTLRKWSLDTGRMLAVMEVENPIPYLSGQRVDGNQVLAGNDAGLIDLWDISQQSRLYTFSRLDGEVLSMDVTANGRILATGSNEGDVVLWDIEAQDQIHFQHEHSDPVVSVAFTTNGREFFSVDRDGTTVVWNMESLPVPEVVQKYQAQVQTAVLNETQNMAAIAGADGSVRILDMQTGQLQAEFKGDTASVSTILAMSQGGNHLAAAIDDGAALIVWDIESEKETFVLEEAPRVTGLLFEPGGRVLMTARTNHSIERRDIRSGSVLETMHGHSSPVQVMAFAPNGVTMASGAQDGMIFIWDMDDNSILNRIHAHAGAISGLGFSTDGNFLYSTGIDGKLHLWRVSNGDLESTLADEPGILKNLSLAEEQGLVSSIYQDDQVGFWTNTAVEITVPLGGLYGAVQALKLADDGIQLLIVDGDGVVQSFQIAESIAPSEAEIAAAMATHTPEAAAEETTEDAEIVLPSQLPAPIYFLSDASGSMQVWRMETDGHTTAQITYENYPVTSFDVAQGTDHMAFVSNNDLILTDKSGDIRWVIQDGETFPPNAVEEAQRKAITDLQFSPDGWRLSYGLNGVHIYSILNDSDTHLMENLSVGTDSAVIYHPLMYSPGGNNLYIQIEESDRLSLMVVSSWTGEEYAVFEEGPCCQPQINAEQDAVYFTGRDGWGNSVGLWLVDIWHDTLEEILPATGSTAEHIIAFPIQDPFTEDLIFFYAPYEKKSGVSLTMARALDDGVSLLQVIRADSFSNLTDVLWAPDASLVVISDPVTAELSILFVEDRPSIPLGIQGTMMRWGN